MGNSLQETNLCSRLNSVVFRQFPKPIHWSMTFGDKNHIKAHILVIKTI
jgi:hypothetical protein